VHLIVNATVSHQNFEGALLAPGVVPGVHAQPVVLVVFNSPTDYFDSVTTLGCPGQVLVNARRVCEEVFVYSKGCSDTSVIIDLLLDSVDTLDAIC